MKPSYLFVLPLVLVGCGTHAVDKEEKPVVAVRVAAAEAGSVTLSVRAPATLFAREQASVAGRVTAPIRELRVRKGDRVTAGQVLAVLESRDVRAQQDEARAALEDAQASLEKAQSGTLPTDIERARGQVENARATLDQATKIYERRKELFAQGAIPQRELLTSQTEQVTAKTNFEVARRALDLLEHQSGERDIRIAQSRLAQAQARLNGATATLNFTEIRAPFAGTITEQFQYPGDMAQASSPVFTIADVSVVIARAQVPETQARQIRIGTACSFGAEDSDSLHAGRTTVVNGAVDPQRRTVEIWCEIGRPPLELRPGVFGTVAFQTGRLDGIVLVPAPAVQFEEGTTRGTVLVLQSNGTVRQKAVEAREPESGKVPILSGVSAGEKVVVEGGYGVPDGTAVQVAGGGQQ